MMRFLSPVRGQSRKHVKKRRIGAAGGSKSARAAAEEDGKAARRGIRGCREGERGPQRRGRGTVALCAGPERAWAAVEVRFRRCGGRMGCGRCAWVLNAIFGVGAKYGWKQAAQSPKTAAASARRWVEERERKELTRFRRNRAGWQRDTAARRRIGWSGTARRRRGGATGCGG